MFFAKGRKKLRSCSAALDLSLPDALRQATAGLASPAKVIAQVARRSERTAQGWLAGDHQPSASDLIRLMREFDTLADAVIEAADRKQPFSDRQRQALRALLED